MRLITIDGAAFKRGVNDALTLRPLRLLLRDWLNWWRRRA